MRWTLAFSLVPLALHSMMFLLQFSIYILLFTQENDTFYVCQRLIYRCYFRIGTKLCILLLLNMCGSSLTLITEEIVFNFIIFHYIYFEYIYCINTYKFSVTIEILAECQKIQARISLVFDYGHSSIRKY